MAQGKVGSLYFTLGVNASDFEKKLNMATTKIADFGAQAKRIGQSMSLFITTPIVAAGTAAVNMASDYDESLNKVDVAFKEASGSVREFAKETLRTYGIAEGTALDMAALFGDMATSMGISTGEAANLSTSMVGLAGDLASFKNMNIKEVTTALNGVFTGETESLKRLGVVMTEVNLEQFAMQQGISKTIQEMTQAEKVLLRYQYVMSVTSNAHGDFERTGGGAANQMRVFTEGLKELAVQFGQVILPAFTRAIKAVNGWMESLMAMDEGQRRVIITIGAVVAATGPLLYAMGSLAAALPTLVTGFALLNKVLLSNPIALVVVGMIALVDTIDKVVAATKKEVDVVKKAIEVNTQFAASLGSATEQYSKYLTAKQNSVTYSKKEADAIIENIKAKKAEVTANRELLEGLRAVENARIRSLEKKAGNKGNLSLDQITELAQRREAVKEMTATIEASRRSEIEMGAAIAEVTKSVNESTDAFKAFNPAGKTVGEIEMRIDALSTALKGMVPHSKEYNAAMAEISRLKLTIDSKEATTGLTEAEKAAKKMQEALNGLFESVNKNDIFTKIGDDIKNKFISAVEAAVNPFARIDAILLAVGEKVDVFDGLGDSVKEAFDPLQQLFESLKNVQKETSSLLDIMTESFGLFFGHVLTGVQSLAAGLGEALGGSAGGMKAWAKQVINALAAAAAAALIAQGALTGIGLVAALAGIGLLQGVFNQLLSESQGGGVPKFAAGGAVTGPTLALVGENPASRGEAIIPFERMGSFLQQFGMGGSGEQHITISGQLAGDVIRLSGQKSAINNGRVRWGRGTALVN